MDTTRTVKFYSPSEGRWIVGYTTAPESATVQAVIYEIAGGFRSADVHRSKLFAA